jgi:L-fuconolactonase
MRIDAHQHFWTYQPARDGWITDEMSILKRDFLPEDLLPELGSAGIEGCIAVQADQSEEETRFLLGLADKHPTILGVVGWVDLRAPDIAERLARFRRFKSLCGFRHIVQAELDDRFMLQADFRRGISCLAQFDFTYDILIYPRQLRTAIALVEAYPEHRFVVDHAAKPEIRSGKLQPWGQLMHELAAAPNVFCKLSGLITEADWTRWKSIDLKPYLDIVFEAFGPQRLLFGSDWPVCLLAGNYSQVVSLLSSYLKGRPREEQAAIFGGNAARVYRLNENPLTLTLSQRERGYLR